VKTLLRHFFRLLYHQFAFTYDLVAAVVSFNRWKDWVMRVIPFIQGHRILEIGHGPGHLQSALLNPNQRGDRDQIVIGIDESVEMGRLARRNLMRSYNSKSRLLPGSPKNPAYTQTSLTRGLAQNLPFPNESFDTIVATFPTEYITDPETLVEVKRCLRGGGRLVTLPVALPKNLFLDWLFKVTHQSPTEALEVVRSRLREPFVAADFQTEVETLDVKSGILLIVLAKK
jgi:ubiquinone/menaquinone biosynthesis C-methylase UbiE